MLQYVDNMNVMYVALTRARECMEVIAALPEGKLEALEGLGQVKTEVDTDLRPLANFADILYWYAHAYGKDAGFVPVEAEEDAAPAYERKSFIYGQIPVAEKKEDNGNVSSVATEFFQWGALHIK